MKKNRCEVSELRGVPFRQHRAGPRSVSKVLLRPTAVWTSTPRPPSRVNSDRITPNLVASASHLHALAHSSFQPKTLPGLIFLSTFPAGLAQVPPSLSHSLARLPQSPLPFHSHELDTQLSHNTEHTVLRSRQDSVSVLLPPRLELIKGKWQCPHLAAAQWPFSEVIPELTLEE